MVANRLLGYACTEVDAKSWQSQLHVCGASVLSDVVTCLECEAAARVQYRTSVSDCGVG